MKLEYACPIYKRVNIPNIDNEIIKFAITIYNHKCMRDNVFYCKMQNTQTTRINWTDYRWILHWKDKDKEKKPQCQRVWSKVKLTDGGEKSVNTILH